MVIALGFIFVLGLINSVSSSPRVFSIEPIDSQPGDPYAPTEEQQALLKQLGPPDTFMLLFYQDGQADQNQSDVRLEIWTYYVARQEVTMLDGRIIDQIQIEALSEPLASMPYHPAQFKAGMDINEALRASNLREYLRAPLEDEEVQNGTLIFGEQVAMGFQDGKLSYVESFPLAKEEQP